MTPSGRRLAELNLNQLLEGIARMCVETFSADRAVLAVQDHELTIRAAADRRGNIPLDDARTASDSVPLSLLIRAQETKRPIAFDSAASGATHDPYFSKHQVHAALVIPLESERLLAVLYLEKTRAGVFSIEEVCRKQQVLDVIAAALETNHQLQECWRVEKPIKMMFTQFPGAVWTTDRELRFTYVAGRLLNATNRYPPIGSSIYDVLGTHDPTDPAIAHHLAALAGVQQAFDYEFYDRCYSIRIEPLRDENDAIVGCGGAGVDVTEHRSMVRKLGRSEARLAEAQRVAHVGSFEWDIGPNVVAWSDEMHRIYGVKQAEFTPSYEGFLQFVPENEIKQVQSTIFDGLRAAKPFEYEHRIIRSDGSERMLLTRADVISNDDGTPSRLVGSCWDITQLTQTMNELKHARSVLEATIEATADGILVVSREGSVTAYNRRFLSYWRIPTQLINNGHDERLLSFVLDQLEDPEAFMENVRDIYSHPDQERFDIVRLRDGRIFERYSIPQHVNEELVGRVWSFRDVTERERLYGRAVFLGDAARLLATLDIEPALDSVAHLAVPFIADECAIDLLGSGGPRRLLAVSRDPAKPVQLELHSSVLAGHPILYRAGLRSFMAVPLIIRDVVVGAMSFVAAQGRSYTDQDLDLARELASRAALAVANAELYQRANEAVKGRDEFLSIAAHEIRGPITSIHMAVQGLQSGKLPADALAKALDVIEREDRRLVRFVDELLDLGAIRSGRIHFNFEPVDLGNLVREASSRLGGELTKSGSSLSISTTGHPVGMWDRFRLDQVITNLLTNAIKFGLGKPIAVEVSERAGHASIVVKDQGLGIPADMRERIFDPFERAAPVRHHGGLGLGLFIVRTIVDGLGGDVQVESEQNAGSTFKVQLPIAA